jgi:hypothetical protein
MSAPVRALGLALALAAFGCREAAAPAAGIGARVTLDRTETQVGDPVGVTVEIETPAGFRVQTPPAPSGGPFASDSVKLVEPTETATGLRHHLLWVVRAREVGDHELPYLEVPLVRADGAVQPLRVGGMPLPVRSVRADLPRREAVFDIRDAPPEPPTPPWVFGAAALALAALVWLGRVLRRRALAAQARSTRLADAGNAAVAALADAASSGDARSFAARVREALFQFIGGAWGVETASATPDELGPPVDRELLRILATVERARFAPQPELPPLLPLAGQASERVRHVANLRAR